MARRRGRRRLVAAAIALRMRWACAAEYVADSLEGAVCTAPLDFVLLVDNSGSLTDFVDSVDNFMVEFINSFALSSAGPMISLILFNTEAETTVLRGLSHDADDLLASIANERPQRGVGRVAVGAAARAHGHARVRITIRLQCKWPIPAIYYSDSI